MRTLLAAFCLYLSAFFVVGCTPARDSPANQARVTVANRSVADTISVESLVDTARILPGDKLDLQFGTNGIQRIQLQLPHDTVTFAIHIETQAHHSYINFPSSIDAP